MEPTLMAKALINRKMRLLCIWCAVPMVVLLFGGLTLSGFISPIHPSASAAEVAHQYRTDTDAIRIGLAISFLGVIFLLPFGAAIAAQTRRIETAPPVLTYTQTASFAAGSLIFVIPWVCWMTAAFRPERADSEILLLNDLGWICFVFAYVAFTAWLIAVGLAILSDISREPVYPRWLGYASFFVAISFMPDNLIPFFKTGPFDWRGIFPYWLPFALYGIWILVMLGMTVKAINREAVSAPNETEARDEAKSDRARLAGAAT
jgi:hypothetical protein